VKTAEQVTEPVRWFKAVVGLSYPTNPNIIRRLVAGEDIPVEERGMKDVKPGEVVNDVPAVSQGWLLESNAIVAVNGPEDADEANGPEDADEVIDDG